MFANSITYISWFIALLILLFITTPGIYIHAAATQVTSINTSRAYINERRWKLLGLYLLFSLTGLPSIIPILGQLVSIYLAVRLQWAFFYVAEGEEIFAAVSHSWRDTEIDLWMLFWLVWIFNMAVILPAAILAMGPELVLELSHLDIVSNLSYATEYFTLIPGLLLAAWWSLPMSTLGMARIWATLRSKKLQAQVL